MTTPDFSNARTPDASVSTSRISTLRRMTPSVGMITPTFMSFAHSNASKTIKSEASMENSVDFALTFTEVNTESTEESIRHFIELGDIESAVYWIDAMYAKDCDDGIFRPVKLANYVKALTSVSQWMRVTSTLENSKLISRHLVYAYYYLNSLYQRRMYNEIPLVAVGNLLDDESLPIKCAKMPGFIDLSYSLGDEIVISSEDHNLLDNMAQKLRIRSAIYVVYGQTFLQLENRAAASICLCKALFLNPKCLLAERLLQQYKLIGEKCERRMESLIKARSENDSVRDPRCRSAKALAAYRRGDARAALAITKDIIQQHGLYRDCLLTHINSLVQLEDADTLFLFSHRLVDAIPDHEYSWYSVALYYHVAKNAAAAKNFMNKATMMNTGFGEGWLAFGHILSAASENEQALSCYYRASRILERNYEPLLYVAMQYCKSGVELAEQFLQDASDFAPLNPIILHEQGMLAFNRKDFPGAQTSFEKALYLMIRSNNYNVDVNGEEGMVVDDEIAGLVKNRITKETLRSPITPFWEPLINNLGHCARRRHNFEDAIMYHQRALVMNPRQPAALTSLAMSYAALDDTLNATRYIHKALAINPFDEIARGVLNGIVQVQVEMPVRLATDVVGPLDIPEIASIDPSNVHDLMVGDELTELLSLAGPAQQKAAATAKLRRRCVAAQMDEGSFLQRRSDRTRSSARLRNMEQSSEGLPDVDQLAVSPIQPDADDVMDEQ